MRKTSIAGLCLAGLCSLAVVVRVGLTIHQLREGRFPGLVYDPEGEVYVLEWSLTACGVFAILGLLGAVLAILTTPLIPYRRLLERIDFHRKIESRTLRIAAWALILAAAIPCGAVVGRLPEEAAVRVVLAKIGEVATREEILVPANRVFQAVRIALVPALCAAATFAWKIRRYLPESVVIACHGFVVGALFTLARLGAFGMELYFTAP